MMQGSIPTNQGWELYVDGSAIPDKSGSFLIDATYALYQDGQLVEEDRPYVARGTINQAECIAVIYALKRIRELGLQGCKIYSDSQLAVRWATGVMQKECAVAGTKLWYPKVRKALSEQGTELLWTRRKHNKAHGIETKYSIL